MDHEYRGCFLVLCCGNPFGIIVKAILLPDIIHGQEQVGIHRRAAKGWPSVVQHIGLLSPQNDLTYPTTRIAGCLRHDRAKIDFRMLSNDGVSELAHHSVLPTAQPVVHDQVASQFCGVDGTNR
ncbi:hypothetical protein ACUNV4_26250 [Granulosicoccus sp. 3-233]|uniref:hypothetical protein n=1 Tax=Granulosicoccus sp. 3-233 TaxID=3417969 RepID=UPI003D3427AD